MMRPCRPRNNHAGSLVRVLETAVPWRRRRATSCAALITSHDIALCRRINSSSTSGTIYGDDQYFYSSIPSVSALLRERGLSGSARRALTSTSRRLKATALETDNEKQNLPSENVASQKERSNTPGEDRRQKELANAKALRWLSLVETERDSLQTEEASDTSSAASESISAEESEMQEVTDNLIRSRVSGLPSELLLKAVQQAWRSDGDLDAREGGNGDRHAALALYEAGVAAGAICADVPWACASAGVVDLCNDWFLKNPQAGLCALHVVLKRMLQRHAFEEQVTGHVHDPRADLLVVLTVDVNAGTRSILHDAVWLLENEYSRFGADSALNPPELVGNHQSDAHAPILVLDMGQIEEISKRHYKRGVVLCFPRLQLQRWLLAEGRARRGCTPDTDAPMWSPPWLELELGDMPDLPPVVQSEAN